jgi:hypothetical protein
MNKKEIVECHCHICDSEFKLVYVTENVSAYHKFCPFCGDELFDYDNEEEDKIFEDGENE